MNDNTRNESTFTEYGVTWFLRSLVLSVIVTAVGIWAYDKYLAPKLMVVDVLAFDAAQRKALIAGHIDEKEALRRVETIKETLSSYPSNVIFLRSDMVIENGEELQFDFKH